MMHTCLLLLLLAAVACFAEYDDTGRFIEDDPISDAEDTINELTKRETATAKHGWNSYTLRACRGSGVYINRKDCIIQSPGMNYRQNYPSNTRCKWRIQAPRGKVVKVKVIKPKIHCGGDSLKIYDYENNKIGRELASICGNQKKVVVTSSTNSVYIVFTSDRSRSGKGFRIKYQWKKVPKINCGAPPINPSLAGVFGGNPGSKIIGGLDVRPHSWPWMASLTVYDWDIMLCGATLLHKRWAVTAAHCVYGVWDAIDLGIMVGQHVQNKVEKGTQIVRVKSMTIHEQFNDFTNDFDIVLMELEDDIIMTDHIHPVCLDSLDVPDETICLATGWGSLHPNNSVFPDILQQAILPIVSQTVCNRPDWYNNTVTANMMCAGYAQGGKDSCDGDSGGPLVCKTADKWTLYGITSWGIGCAEGKHPGVYTRVAHFTDWIRTKSRGAVTSR